MINFAKSNLSGINLVCWACEICYTLSFLFHECHMIKNYDMAGGRAGWRAKVEAGRALRSALMKLQGG